jgi:hypothetical protein
MKGPTMIESVEEINSQLIGFTEVVELNLKADSARGALDLKLRLANSSGEILLISCLDVSSLDLSEFGGGLTQLLLLRCSDLRENQLDRVKFHFSEVERNSISFDCASMRLSHA